MEVFQDYAYYYNAFYRDKDYREEAGQIVQLLERFGNHGKQILNFGCGTGKHDIELYKLGYQCTGIDLSPVMIDEAKRNAEFCQEGGTKMVFSVADIRQYEAERKYDAVISLFHVMSYQNSNEDILNAFISARKALENGGIFLFDTWYGPGVLSDKPVVRVKEVEDEENRLIRVARPVMYDKENKVEVHYEVFVMNKKTSNVKVIQEVHSMRYFFRPELELLLKEAGFELIDNLDGQSLQETDYDSWTSYFIAKAI